MLRSLVGSEMCIRDSLESEDLSLFNSQPLHGINPSDPSYNQIVTLIVNKLNSTLEKLIASKTNNIRLNYIIAFTKTLPKHQSDQVYLKSYDLLAKTFDDLEKKHPTPFIDNRTLRFHSDIAKNVNKAFHNLIRLLPDQFQPLRRQYGIWCNNNVITAATKREKNPRKYQKSDLVTMAEAAEIASYYHNKEANLKMARIIKENTSSSSSGEMGITQLVLKMFLFISCLLYTSPSPRDS